MFLMNLYIYFFIIYFNRDGVRQNLNLTESSILKGSWERNAWNCAGYSQNDAGESAVQYIFWNVYLITNQHINISGD